MLSACVSTVSLDELLQEGHDHPRERVHTHTDEEVRVEGIVVDFENEAKDRGLEFEATTTTWGDAPMSTSETTGTVHRKIEHFMYIDLRATSDVPGYAQCRISEETADIPAAASLMIGDHLTVVGTFTRYERSPAGLRAVLEQCRVD